MPGKKLLVADDSLTIQKVIRLALSNEGYEIQAISDGADAIQHIATFRPDCVLIDVSLPTRTAFEIKREINGMEDHRSTRFILMSSAFEKIDDAQADEVGFDGRLTKPFDPAHLRQVLLEVLTAPRAPKSLPSQGAPQGAAQGAPQERPTMTGIQLEPPRNFPSLDFDLPLTAPGEGFGEGSGDGLGNGEDELWGKHEEEASTPPPVPISERDEIKQLTESTIRMSGLADIPIKNDEEFDWTVNEPSIKPPSSMADLGGSSFHVGPDSPETPPPLPQMASQLPGEPGESGDSRDNDEHQDHTKFSFAGDQNLEEIVRRQVQETLEKMTRQILPEVAERVIKAEINKLLNEKF
jgi:CheY-like chemotaxis protein